jgi:hypothetical protein
MPDMRGRGGGGRVGQRARRKTSRTASASGRTPSCPSRSTSTGCCRRSAACWNLQWTHRSDPEPDGRDETDLVAPPAEEMKVLVHLAQMGNMRSIRERAEHLASLDETYRPFARRLRQLAERFQSRAILDFVRRHQERQLQD